MEELKQGGYLFSKIHQLSGRIFAKKLKSHGINEINPAQGRILFALWQEDHISLQQLSKKTALGKSTLTRMLDRLEESGHVTRIYPQEDRRKILIELTDENREMKASYQQVSMEMLQLFYNGFSEQETDQIEGYLKRILNNLNDFEF
ncbi:MAG: MarR family transcriptional regulator [Bacillota bacterium]|nr:MarR family transcriptional regulator [Bacillota bacterium]